MSKEIKIADNKGYEHKHTQKNKARRLASHLISIALGVSSFTVASAILVYDAFFMRYSRPDYTLYPGEYVFERLEGKLKREEFYFSAGKSQLKGYYYPSTEGKALVVIVHGFHAGADDFLPVAKSFVERGYNVFSYDATGVYDSFGDSSRGMCQALVDLDNVLTYISKTQPYSNQKVCLFGHSWGGYAVTSVLELHREVSACVAVAPMNNGYTIMVEKGVQYAGGVAKISKPIFDEYQKYLFKDYVKYNGLRGVNSTDIPVLIAHGKNDEVILFDKQSVISYRNQITNPNVDYYVTEGLNGSHNGILLSKEALKYRESIDAQLENLASLKGKKLTKAEKRNFYLTVDHALYSEVNAELIDKAIKTFEKA
ncbi:MAG: alpha/beta fold hydrolase [Clostridia bacterium]|nr:alpha/beta fold hydrolase [Clostridia bacterium]